MKGIVDNTAIFSVMRDASSKINALIDNNMNVAPNTLNPALALRLNAWKKPNPIPASAAHIAPLITVKTLLDYQSKKQPTSINWVNGSDVLDAGWTYQIPLSYNAVNDLTLLERI